MTDDSGNYISDEKNEVNYDLKGRLLLSAPFLNDIFKRSVILITENNKEGSVGFILNKETDFKLHEIIEDFPEFNSKVFIGGPVQQDSLNFIHRAGDILNDSYEISDGIYWGGNIDHLKLLIESNALSSDDFRFFLGYSGWGSGQLENELSTKSWYLGNPDPDNIFNDESSSLWSKILRRMGNEYSVISTFPEDPSLN
ncbi:MAG: YqgE/AlgH family protein [Ignavibacteria bacterium]|nr:YqgE/AlgH family protein [Ignavibacteria bacterium]